MMMMIIMMMIMRRRRRRVWSFSGMISNRGNRGVLEERPV
jgi:hypothetical protein